MKNRQFKTQHKKNNLTKEKYLERWRNYYYDCHEYHLSRNRKYYLERMFEWYDWFKEAGYSSCEICGFDGHPKALDFHHIDPAGKLFGIGKFINGRQCTKENQGIIVDEIKKCKILCANCHRIEHFVLSNEYNSKGD